ncbi:MAG: DNA polymerase III subunit delta [Actinomycetales bacterium]|nr:DNA polymerase III subunit delta [Actinomycetales bacterium]
MAKAIVVEWRKATPAPFVFVSGPENYTADTAIRAIREQLRKKHPILEVHDLDASSYQSGELLGLASPSLFAEPRLIIIRNVERCTDALIVDGLDLLQSPADDTYVIFRHNGSSVRGKKLTDALKGSDQVVEILNPEIKWDNQRAQFVQSEFAHAKRAISPGAIRDLANAFSENLGELAAACEQILLDEDATITEATVDRYYGGRIEANGLKVADVAFNGTPAQAIAVLRHSLASGVQAPPLIGALASKMRAIAKLHDNRSASPQSLGMSPYAADQIRRLVPAWNEEGIARVLLELASADFATKGGERDPDFALERLITLIAYKGELPAGGSGSGAR